MRKIILFLFVIAATSLVSAQNIQENDTTIYSECEKNAAFPGGDEELIRFIERNLHYPNMGCCALDEQVLVRFVIEKDGSTTNFEVLKNSSRYDFYEEEAVRVLELMPKWISAENKGKPVRSSFTIPIVFKPKR